MLQFKNENPFVSTHELVYDSPSRIRKVLDNLKFLKVTKRSHATLLVDILIFSVKLELNSSFKTYL